MNTLSPGQDGHLFGGRHFQIKNSSMKSFYLDKKNSLKFITKCPINNIPPLVQIMAWRRPGDKPLSEPMMVTFTDAFMRHSAALSKPLWLLRYTPIKNYVIEDLFSPLRDTIDPISSQSTKSIAMQSSSDLHAHVFSVNDSQLRPSVCNNSVTREIAGSSKQHHMFSKSVIS